MVKHIYVIRHCEAQGQSSDASLTEHGFQQAEVLADFFTDKKIERIIASPFLRAIQTIEPLSTRENINIEIDERLSERILSTRDLPDWYEKLQATFTDMDLKFDGGESSNEAMKRIVHVVEETLQSDAEHSIIVSHGNIITLLLKYYNNDVDIQVWGNLSNPDIFQLSTKHNEITLERVWK
ncbi:phosphoglycerate mutase [Lysinibacillus sp. FJAT-14745]|uniref:histidine phosphatase family protein n=1 Tax=Lysinibacillus sp. FJAT-14745 TaxID=1704289 RepID=UPI0006ABC8EE|nr:histidine phosphatase family protein [Lysinibacillus sp. FJAT-14745]KOP80970.1 phosphoglycerate mutase [Lysinibacillus sp. FJAT-14745]